MYLCFLGGFIFGLDRYVVCCYFGIFVDFIEEFGVYLELFLDIFLDNF